MKPWTTGVMELYNIENSTILEILRIFYFFIPRFLTANNNEICNSVKLTP